MQYILIYGTLKEGFRFVGPFEDIEVARAYIASEPEQANISLVELDIPAANEEG